MSLFLKLYFALFVVVVAVLFYGTVLVPRNVQLTSRVQSESVQLPDTREKVVAPELDDFFIQARRAIPEDDPIGPMGSCPPSKPFSTDLPIANIPLFMAKSDQNMKLHAL